jgi:hypothetical protein
VAPCLSLFSPLFAMRRSPVRSRSRPPNYFALRKPDAPSGFRRYETGRVGLYSSEFRKACVGFATRRSSIPFVSPAKAIFPHSRSPSRRAGRSMIGVAVEARARQLLWHFNEKRVFRQLRRDACNYPLQSLWYAFILRGVVSRDRSKARVVRESR